ncbi:hypothetical protein SI65_03469 [Aspergillus cristatus]|uniref:mRNA degradation protein pet127, mitochondrial n=1 Tax=Aspergillus cristatus TaxID=573508 RepID=A0A1E3BJ58_ASPCR|nr:hypothetical protein SI65_03469 [Aspergillus cristatus]
MFRASLRSASDPLREHVCLSCLTRRFGGNIRSRPFHTTLLRRNEPGDGSAANGTAQSNAPPNSAPIPENKSILVEAKPPSPESTLKDEQKPAAQEEPGSETATQATQKTSKTSKGKKNTERKTRKAIARQARRAAIQEKERKRAEQAELRAKANQAKTKAKGKPDVLSAISKGPQLTPAQKLRTATNADRESAGNVAFLLNESHKRDTGSLNKEQVALAPLDVETAEVPRLSFGLERVLFNPGVYNLRDPRSRVYNFDPYLGSIMPVTEFDFAALKEYITSSKDTTLRDIARKEKKKYVGSSSSMTSVLSQFHYLLSSWRGINTQTLSQGFPDKLRTFTRLLRAPSAMFLRYQDGVYAIDADKEFDSANILMNLGKSMEKLLTLPKEDFERYRRSSDNKITPEEEQAVPESYHYSTLGDFVMRSQLDAYDPRLPGTGMFDLKTRAVVSIRMDAQNFEHGLGYEIKGQYGAFESYEREFFDMIRAAFLKYSLQVRIGRMDGIFVAFHNIERIFGFQYVSLPELDQTLHGQSDTALGDAEFRLSLGLWNKILDKATERFPERSLRFHFETRDAATPFMYIFAEPVTDEEINSIQTRNAAEINAYQQRILNLSPKGDEDDVSSAAETPSETEATQEHAKEVDVTENAISESTTPSETPSEATSSEDSATTETKKEEEPTEKRELFAMTLMIKNKVNGKEVERPTDFKSTHNWEVDYELIELPTEKARVIYGSCQRRRQKSLMGRGEDETDVAANVYIRKLREISKAGRKFRQEQEKLDKEKGVVVLDESA